MLEKRGATSIARRAAALQPSPLQQFFRKVKTAEGEGRKIISLGVGEPHYDVAPAIKEAVIAAVQQGVGYSPAIGSSELRLRIADLYGISPVEVAVGTGAKALLAAVFGCLVEDRSSIAGTSLLLPAPFYPPFQQTAGNYYGAGIVPIDTKPAGFQLTFQAVREAAHRAAKHKVLIINSPNNPTGMVYDRAELERIVSWCVKEGITVISDECYSAFSPDPDFSLRQLSPEVIVVDSFSKAHAMMGYRLGYVLAPPELIERLQLYAENLLGCPSAVAEAAGLAALKLPPVPDYAEQRSMIQGWLEERRVAYGKSSGGIYAFADFSPQIKRLGLDGSVGLAEHLLAATDVAVTPGNAFGDAYGGYLRLSYALDPAPLSVALAKLDKALF